MSSKIFRCAKITSNRTTTNTNRPPTMKYWRRRPVITRRRPAVSYEYIGHTHRANAIEEFRAPPETIRFRGEPWRLARSFDGTAASLYSWRVPDGCRARWRTSREAQARLWLLASESREDR